MIDRASVQQRLAGPENLRVARIEIALGHGYAFLLKKKGAGRMSELLRLKTAPPAPAVSASAGVFSVPGLGQGRIYVGLNPVEARAKFDRLRQAACFDIAVNRRPAAPADLCLQVREGKITHNCAPCVCMIHNLRDQIRMTNRYRIRFIVSN